MTNPFNWLRIIRLVVALLFTVFAVYSGLPTGIGGGQLTPLAILTSIIDGASGSRSDSTGGSSNGIVEFLAEIVDLPLGSGSPPPPVVAPPESPGGVGGVLGGGVSSGPDGTSTPVQQATATQSPLIPTAPAVSTETPRSTATPNAAPTATIPPRPTPTAPVATSTPVAVELRLDDPVLRFLPELRTAADSTGVPFDVLAGVVRVESNGDPNLIASGRGRGLTGVSEAELSAQGVPPDMWHDPATNLLAGARVLATLIAQTGSWDAAVGQYFGASCDPTGTCSGAYRYAVVAWADYYGPAIANPNGGGFPILPTSWSLPNLVPYEGASPRPLPLPPGIAPPTATPAATPTVAATATQAPTATTTATPSPTMTAVPPTETPLPLPTETESPTETPVPTPTEAP